MPSKFPKPFFRSARKAWFLQGSAKQIKLGPDRDAAFRRDQELTGQSEAPPPPADSTSVVGGRDAFLDWCRDYLESFARTSPSRGGASTSMRAAGRSPWTR